MSSQPLRCLQKLTLTPNHSGHGRRGRQQRLLDGPPIIILISLQVRTSVHTEAGERPVLFSYSSSLPHCPSIYTQCVKQDLNLLDQVVYELERFVPVSWFHWSYFCVFTCLRFDFVLKASSSCGRVLWNHGFQVWGGLHFEYRDWFKSVELRLQSAILIYIINPAAAVYDVRRPKENLGYTCDHLLATFVDSSCWKMLFCAATITWGKKCVFLELKTVNLQFLWCYLVNLFTGRREKA